MRALLILFAAALALPAADKPSAERRAEAAKRFAKLKDYVAERRATHIVELLAEWGDCAGQDEQAEVTKFAEALVADANEDRESVGLPKRGLRLPKLKDGEVSHDTKTDSSTYFVDDFISLRETTGFTGCPRVFGRQVVAATMVRAQPSNENAEESVILTNAPLAEFKGLRRCVVVSSGSLALGDRFRGGDMDASLVVCRGDAEYLFRPPIRPSGFVRLGGVAKNLDDNRKPNGKRTEPDPRFVTENDTKLLGVKFYSTADDGLTLDTDAGGVTVMVADGKKVFGKAGVRKGDVIVSVNGERLFRPSELDRVVARATVASGVAKLKVKREGKEETVEVTLFDWSAYKPKDKKDDLKAPAPDKK